jgi:signal peptidase I
MHLPEIHIIESNGHSLGFCVERPFLIKMSDVAKAILRLHASNDRNDNINLQPLLGQYEQSDIQQALDELLSLEKKSRESMDGFIGSADHLQVLTLEVLSGSTQELLVIKKSISFLLQGLGTGEVGTMILDLRCSSSLHFCTTVWKFGMTLAKKQSKYLRIILKISLLSLNNEIVSLAKTIPVEILLVTTAECSYANLPISVKTNLEQLLLRIYPVGIIEKSSKSQPPIDLKMFSRIGICIIHQGAGDCAFSCVFPELPVSMAIQNDSPTYSAPSEMLKYLSSLTTSIPSEHHCGAGRWYLAVSSSGKIYPCHRFINDDRFLAGHIDDASLDNRIFAQFEGIKVTEKPVCQKCWARHLCGGGCAHNAVSQGKPLNDIDASTCTNIMHNIEQAALFFAKMDDTSKTMTGKLIHTMANVLPYWQDSPIYKSGTITLVSKGRSMYPLIQDGAEVTLLYTHPRDIRTGDIFSYRQGQKIITHRVILKKIKNGKTFLIEKGDNAFFADASNTEVLGKVISLKNPDMNRPIRLDTRLWRLGNKLIVVVVMTLWLTYYGYWFTSKWALQKIKRLISALKVASSPEARTILSLKSERLLAFTNRLTGYITSFFLFIYNKGNRYGNS